MTTRVTRQQIAPPPQWTLSLVTWITFSPTETCSNHVELRINFLHNLKDSTLILHQFVCVCVLNVTSRNSFWNWIIHAMSLFKIEFLEICQTWLSCPEVQVRSGWSKIDAVFGCSTHMFLGLLLEVACSRCAENFDSGTPQCQILAMISSQTNSPFRCHMSWNAKHLGAETKTGNPQCPATMQSKTSVVTLLNFTVCPSPALHRPLKTENLPNLHRNWNWAWNGQMGFFNETSHVSAASITWGENVFFALRSFSELFHSKRS